MPRRISTHATTRKAARRSTSGFASVHGRTAQLALGLGRLAPALPRCHPLRDTPVGRRRQLRPTPARILRVLESNLADVAVPTRVSEKFKPADIQGLVRVQPTPIAAVRQNPNHLAILAPLVSQDELRPAINGVLLDAPNQCVVATNGHLLVRLQEANLKGSRSIVHPKTGKNIDERYPDYENIIPLAERPYEGLIANLPRLMAQLTGIVKANRWINYAADVSSSGHIRVEVQMGGGYYYFDPLFLLRVLTALQQAGTTTIRFSLDESPARALLLTDAQRPRQLALLMPIKGALTRKQRATEWGFCPVTLGRLTEDGYVEEQLSTDNLQLAKAKLRLAALALALARTRTKK